MKSSANVMVTIAVVVFSGATVWTAQGRSTSSDVLQQERRFALQARSGSSDVAPAAILSLVKDAVAADPTNSELHRALADVELFQTTTTPAPGGMPDLAALAATSQRALSAYERAIQLDPKNAVATSGRGMMSIISAFLAMKPEVTAKGVADLNKAVELDPSAVVPRLNRAFTSLNLQPPLRNTEATIEDLTFLIAAAEGSRPGDMVHLLLADLYAELGKADEARTQYQAAARRPASAAREQVAARLSALDKGTLPTADIAAMRGSLAFNCAMCHAR